MNTAQLVKVLEKSIEYYTAQLSVAEDHEIDYYRGHIQAYRNVIKTIDPYYEDDGVGISMR